MFHVFSVEWRSTQMKRGLPCPSTTRKLDLKIALEIIVGTLSADLSPRVSNGEPSDLGDRDAGTWQIVAYQLRPCQALCLPTLTVQSGQAGSFAAADGYVPTQMLDIGAFRRTYPPGGFGSSLWPIVRYSLVSSLQDDRGTLRGSE